MNREREIYIAGDRVSLAEYCEEQDVRDRFDCWRDPETESGYNWRVTMDFEEFKKLPVRSRFIAVIIRNADGAALGNVFLSPEGSLPDLAIMLFEPWRGMGYGPEAFSLALQYCFEKVDFDEIYAGCYEHNKRSWKMLQRCGFVPHPEGNVAEKHYLTGEPVTQFDFVKYREKD